VNKFLGRTRVIYYGTGRILIYLFAAAFAGDFKTIVTRTLGIKAFYQNAVSAGVTHYLAYYLDKELEGCDSILDLGCGKSSWLQVCSPRDSVGVEVFEPYLLESRRKRLHTQYILGDIRNIEFKKGSFDAVIASDVIEHLTKEEGRRLVGNMERWARKKVIVSTPNGRVYQEEAVDNNPFFRHLSAWSIAEFEARGFRVYGARGWRSLRDPEGERIKFKPEFVWQGVSALTALVLHRFPGLSVALFCVKAIN
jgi:SAM-dependent methyltransferase